MSENNKPAAPPTSLRVIGGVVILAGFTAAALVAAFASSPLRVSGLFALSLLSSLLISGVGGLLMFSATKSPWWFLALLPVVGGVGVWLLIAMMVPVTLH